MAEQITAKKIIYTAEMKHSAETIRKAAGMQYNTFAFGRKLGQFIASIALLIMGAVGGKSAIGILCLAAGCFLIVSLDYRPKTVADQICRSFKGKFPQLHYFITASGLRTQNTAEETPYSSLIRLIDDGKYLYLYINQATAFMIDKATVNGENGANGLKDYIAGKAGLSWKKPFSLLSMNISTVKDMVSLTGGKKSFTGERLDDTHR